MIIFAMRHAEADSNKDPAEKGRVGDSKVEITENGWTQADRAGKFFEMYRQREGIVLPRFWSSPLLRPRQTLSGFFHGMKEKGLQDKPRVFEDSNLTEQSFGVLPLFKIASENPLFAHIPKEELERSLDIMLLLNKVLYEQEPFLAVPFLGESPMQLMPRFNAISQTVLRDEPDGVNCHFFATHGAMIKAMLLKLNHLSVRDWKNIPTPGNTDIFRIDLEPGTGRVQSCRRIYDGKIGLEDNSNPVSHLKPAGYDDLPSVPDFLRRNGRS